MTAHTTDVYSGKLQPEDSGDIDLRRYFVILLKWWREILVVSIFAGCVAGAAILLLNTSKVPTYSASADILIARLLSTIELDERVSTSTGTAQSDVNGWRTSLLQLAKSSTVATQVLDDLRTVLPETLQSPEALVDVIEADVPLSPDERFASNIIRISAITPDAKLSAEIANSWALHLVDYINGLYGEVPEMMIESVAKERDQALLTYQAAEKQYEDFVANNHVAMLNRQIREKSTLRDEIMINYTRMLTSAVSTEYNARITLYNIIATAPVAYATDLIAAQSAGSVTSLTALYSLHTAANAQLSQARNMERSLLDGGEAAAKSNGSALQLLKLSALASLQADGRLPAIFSSSPMPEIDMTLEEQLTDVRALVAVLEGYVTQLEADITQLAQSTMLGADLATVGGMNIGGMNNGLDAAAAIAETAIYSNVANAYAQLVAPSGILDQAPVDIHSTIDDAHEVLLTGLETEIRTLQAAITAEEAKEQQLVHQRDLAWTTYDTVGNKLQELSLLRSAANSEVRVGNPAMIPLSPEPMMSPVLPVVAFTMLGFLLAAVVAIAVDSLGGGPFLARRSASSLSH